MQHCRLLRAPRLYQVLLGAGVLMLLLLPALCSVTARPPLTYRNLPFPVLNNPVPAGQTVVLRVERCVPGDTPLFYQFTRQLVAADAGGLRLVLPPIETYAAPGCQAVQSYINTLPAGVPPGRYSLEALGLVTTGGWFGLGGRTWVIPWTSEPFDVVTRE